MELILLIINTFLLIICIVLIRTVAKRLKEQQAQISYSTDEPNEVSTAPKNEEVVSEGNPITVNRDTKIEIEGGDSVVPPEYA